MNTRQMQRIEVAADGTVTLNSQRIGRVRQRRDRWMWIANGTGLSCYGTRRAAVQGLVDYHLSEVAR